MTTDERLERVQRALEKEDKAKISEKMKRVKEVIGAYRAVPNVTSGWIARRIIDVMEER